MSSGVLQGPDTMKLTIPCIHPPDSRPRLKPYTMKHILLIAAISLSSTACSKEFSYDGIDQNQQHLIIDDEKGGLNFFVHTSAAEISVNIYDGITQVPVHERARFYEYEVSAGDLRDNTEFTIELQYHSVSAPGTFDVMVEGFTAGANTKKFWIKSVPVSISDAGTKSKFLKMSRSMFRYTFTPY